MTEYDYLHESEDVMVVPGGVRDCRDLWRLLPQLGFRLDEDVFAIDREGTVPIWQSQPIVSVYVLHGEEEVYDEDGQWDRIRLRYLLATLPSDLVGVFVEKATALADALQAPMLYQATPITKADLQEALTANVAELRETVGEPGSKDVAVAIKMTYPRS